VKVKAQLNESTGHVELGVEDDGAFVAFTTMPETQFRSTIENVKSAESAEPAAA
jgi:hypothetical protein